MYFCGVLCLPIARKYISLLHLLYDFFHVLISVLHTLWFHGIMLLCGVDSVLVSDLYVSQLLPRCVSFRYCTCLYSQCANLRLCTCSLLYSHAAMPSFRLCCCFFASCRAALHTWLTCQPCCCVTWGKKFRNGCHDERY